MSLLEVYVCFIDEHDRTPFLCELEPFRKLVLHFHLIGSDVT